MYFVGITHIVSRSHGHTVLLVLDFGFHAWMQRIFMEAKDSIDSKRDLVLICT